MFPVCKASGCGLRHEPWIRCEVARKRATNAEVVVNAVVNTDAAVVNKVSDVVVNSIAGPQSSGELRTKDRHKNTAERREYVRVKMRESRARRRALRVSGGAA